jgi:hypothetical protein
MVREVYREVGVDYPEEVNEDKEECKYCGGDCPNDEEHACDGYLGDIDDLYKVTEAKDKVTYDPKTGKLTGWEHEGDWKKSKGKKKDPVGKIHHMSDVARRRTEKMSQDETLEEAFDRLVNEDTINVGDTIRDKTQPEIQGKVVGDQDENYIIKVDDDHYHILKLNAEKVAELNEAVDLNQLKGQEVYVPGEGTTGIISGQADPSKFSNSLVVNLKNGQQTVVHFKDVQATKPGLGKQLLDKLNAWTGGGTMPKYQPKPIGTVSDLNTPKQFQKLAGIK